MQARRPHTVSVRYVIFVTFPLCKTCTMIYETNRMPFDCICITILYIVL